MSTPFRPELSKKNPFYISKHRYYELRHMCLQYPEWKKAIKEIDGYDECIHVKAANRANGSVSDRVAKAVVRRELYFQKIRMVERVCKEADPTIARYLLKGITEGITYEFLKSRYDIPCSRDYYFNRYHQVFKLLDLKEELKE